MWDREQLFAVFKSELKQLGFSKRASTWHLVFDEVIQIVNLQKSSWSEDDHYLNIALYLRSLGDERKPKVSLGQIHGRTAEIFDPPVSTAVEETLRVNDKRKSSLHSEEVLIAFFRGPFVDFSQKYRSQDTIRDSIVRGELPRIKIYSSARQILGLMD